MCQKLAEFPVPSCKFTAVIISDLLTDEFTDIVVHRNTCEI